MLHNPSALKTCFFVCLFFLLLCSLHPFTLFSRVMERQVVLDSVLLVFCLHIGFRFKRLLFLLVWKKERKQGTKKVLRTASLTITQEPRFSEVMKREDEGSMQSGWEILFPLSCLRIKRETRLDTRSENQSVTGEEPGRTRNHSLNTD